MSDIYVAVATTIATHGMYEDIETEVVMTVVSTRTEKSDAEADLALWARNENIPEGTEVRLTITESDPKTGDTLSTQRYRMVPTIELVADDADTSRSS